MTRGTRNQQALIRASVSIFALSLFATLFAQESPYADARPVSFGPEAETLLDIRSDFDPYSGEFQIVAVLVDGPFAGAIVRGWVAANADGSVEQLGEYAWLTAVTEPAGGYRLVAVIPNAEGRRGVRLVGFTAEPPILQTVGGAAQPR